MANTLIFYEKDKRTEKACQVIGSIIINTKQILLGEEPRNWSQYKNVILIATYKTAREAIAMLKKEHPIKTAVYNIMLVLVDQAAGNTDDLCQEMQQVNPEACVRLLVADREDKVYKAATALASCLSMPEKPMPKDEFLEEVEAFLKAHNICALATGAENYIRCTPIEYEYANGALYIITEGGNKFVGILKNPDVSVTVFEPYTTMAELKGLQIMGEAQLINPNSREYFEAFHKKGIEPETLSKLSIDMNVVKICPKSYEFLSSSFRAEGYDAKQRYDMQ